MRSEGAERIGSFLGRILRTPPALLVLVALSAGALAAAAVSTRATEPLADIIAFPTSASMASMDVQFWADPHADVIDATSPMLPVALGVSIVALLKLTLVWTVAHWVDGRSRSDSRTALARVSGTRRRAVVAISLVSGFVLWVPLVAVVTFSSGLPPQLIILDMGTRFFAFLPLMFLSGVVMFVGTAVAMRWSESLRSRIWLCVLASTGILTASGTWIFGIWLYRLGELSPWVLVGVPSGVVALTFATQVAVLHGRERELSGGGVATDDEHAIAH